MTWCYIVGKYLHVVGRGEKTLKICDTTLFMLMMMMLLFDDVFVNWHGGVGGGADDYASFEKIDTVTYLRIRGRYQWCHLR